MRLFARGADVRDRYRGRATICASAGEAAQGADIVVVFVFSGDQVDELTHGPGSILASMSAGSVLLLHTTVSASVVADVAVAATPYGVRVVDAPVSGTADDIRARTLTVLLGGETEAIAACRPVVECYADTVLRVGGAGAATRVKLVNNSVFAAHVQIAAEAARLSTSLGLDPLTCLDAMRSCSGDSAALRHLLDAGGDPVSFGEVVGPYLRKDVAACLATAAELGADMGVIADAIRSGPLPIQPL